MNTSTTPIRLVYLTLLGIGSFLALFAILSVVLLLSDRTWFAVLGLGSFALAVSFTFVNRYRLSRGIKRNLWTEDQLEIARRFMDQRWLAWVQVALSIGTFSLFAIQLVSPRREADLFGFLLIPAGAITELSILLRRKPGPRNGTFAPVDWDNFKPIHSAHWSKPPAATE
jgi:hypothetical protein